MQRDQVALGRRRHQRPAIDRPARPLQDRLALDEVGTVPGERPGSTRSRSRRRPRARPRPGSGSGRAPPRPGPGADPRAAALPRGRPRRPGSCGAPRARACASRQVPPSWPPNPSRAAHTSACRVDGVEQVAAHPVGLDHLGVERVVDAVRLGQQLEIAPGALEPPRPPARSRRPPPASSIACGPGGPAVAELVGRVGVAGEEHRALGRHRRPAQQIRGSCSPIGRSTTRVPPRPVRATTIRGCSARRCRSGTRQRRAGGAASPPAPPRPPRPARSRAACPRWRPGAGRARAARRRRGPPAGSAGRARPARCPTPEARAISLSVADTPPRVGSRSTCTSTPVASMSATRSCSAAVSLTRSWCRTPAPRGSSSPPRRARRCRR